MWKIKEAEEWTDTDCDFLQEIRSPLTVFLLYEFGQRKMQKARKVR